MEARAQRVRELFEGEQCLVVPVFQRPYVWDRTRNWEPLWTDILAVAEAIHDDSSAEPHFLGAVVLDCTEKDSADISVRQVIDGQQRITTLQIVLCSVRDALTTANADVKLARTLNRLTVNEDQLSTKEFSDFKVWPTLRDRAAFKSIVSGSDRDTAADSRLYDAYEYFYEETLTWLGEHESDPRLATSLVEGLRRGLQLVVIEIDAKDNAQVIFESLNDRGTPLLPSDLIKNSLFQQLERVGADVEQIFEDHWRRLETPFWQEQVRQGRLFRSRVDTFFSHFLTMRTGEEVLTTGLFNRFKEITLAMSGDDLTSLTEEIASSSDVYREMAEKTGASAHIRLLDTAEILDTTVLSPVVLYLSTEAAPDDRTEAFGYIESWLVRRAVLRSTSKNYNRMLLELLKVLRNGQAPYADTVRDFFLDNTSESGRWPTDDEIKETLVSTPIFNSLTRARLRLVLRGCERGLHDSGDPIDELESLDHVVLAGQDDPVDDDARAALGNISLVANPRRLTRATKWDARRPLLAESPLLINADLPQSISDVQISIRGARLAAAFCKTWPHPESPTGHTSEADKPVEPPAASHSIEDRLGHVWADIREYFSGLPVGSVSRVEDRIPDRLRHDGGTAVRVHEAAPGYALREIGGTIYIEKVADVPTSPNVEPLPRPSSEKFAETEVSKRTVNGESISDLIAAGLINEGDRVYHEQLRKGRSFAARITGAGNIIAGGREFTSPSTALSELVGSSRNGWRDWRLERTGETLEQIRERFQRGRNG
ncbi:GmrSD restriction endonuclease domain-containing protein [Gordonia jacobaea]|uniref:GmrSD restriction endonuclease domain-containing protein n=1 Tax=Gordonia jacobaea TaxID=122202 RepID=UPI003D70E3B1